MPDSTTRSKSTRDKPVTLRTHAAEAPAAEAPAKTPRQLGRTELEALRDKLRRKYH